MIKLFIKWLLLNWTQGSVVGVVPNPETWVNRLCELGIEGVEVTQCVRGDIIEGQSASRPVQIHTNFFAASVGNRTTPHLTIMPCREPLLLAKIPGYIIRSETTILTFFFPSNSFVCYSHTTFICVCLSVCNFIIKNLSFFWALPSKS